MKELMALIVGLGPDEVRVLAQIARRLHRGREIYGELKLETDQRDFLQETREELWDALVYRACGDLRGEWTSLRVWGRRPVPLFGLVAHVRRSLHAIAVRVVGGFHGREAANGAALAA